MAGRSWRSGDCAQPRAPAVLEPCCSQGPPGLPRPGRPGLLPQARCLQDSPRRGNCLTAPSPLAVPSLGSGQATSALALLWLLGDSGTLSVVPGDAHVWSRLPPPLTRQSGIQEWDVAWPAPVVAPESCCEEPFWADAWPSSRPWTVASLLSSWALTECPGDILAAVAGRYFQYMTSGSGETRPTSSCAVPCGGLNLARPAPDS